MLLDELLDELELLEDDELERLGEDQQHMWSLQKGVSVGVGFRGFWTASMRLVLNCLCCWLKVSRSMAVVWNCAELKTLRKLQTITDRNSGRARY